MEIRKIEDDDIDELLNLINEHDEDDMESARHYFKNNGLSEQRVLIDENEIKATSGYEKIEGTNNTVFISWTYTKISDCKKGYGKKIFSHIMEELSDIGTVKSFIKISNYKDPKGYMPYNNAMQMYQSFGYQEELISKNFYDKGEDQIILSKYINKYSYTKNILNEKPTIRFNGIYEIEDTDGAYSFSWDVIKDSFFQKRSFSVEDLNIGIDAVKQKKGRIIFITFPSNLPLIHMPLQKAGFKYVGQLENYYENGVHELHFVRNII